MNTDPAGPRERLSRLLGGLPLQRLRERLRARYARGQVGDELTLVALSTDERAALAQILGLPVRNARSLRLRISQLDQTLRAAGLASSLREALEILDGPIRDRKAERSAIERAWDEVLAGRYHARVASLVSDPQARGLIKRLSRSRPDQARALLQGASEVLRRLPAQGMQRSQLAAEALGDAHALDSGRAVATLVLTVLRAPEEDRERQTWARVGVLVNEFARPVLVLNLPVDECTSVGRIVRAGHETGEPTQLSLRALLRAPPAWRVRERDVFVCENPNVLASAADSLGARCAPLVCTDGMPSASQRTLLHQLAAAGARLRYHGDFDWPGIRIGNFVMRSFGASPWRFAAVDYRGHAGRPLVGKPVQASWDGELASAMSHGGYALEEEAVLASLLTDLADSPGGHTYPSKRADE